MPRKSSFLMGFETGQDLYSQGFQQSQQRLQTQQRNQQLKLQQDSQAQRGKLLDMQLRGEELQLGERTRKLNVEADYRKRSSAALLEMQDAVAGARTQQGEAQAWYENRDKLEPEIQLDPENRKYYETWVQKGVLATAEGNAIMAEEQDRKLLAIAKLTHQKNQRLADYTTRTTAFKITGKTYTDDADGTATAQSDIFAAQARGMYIKGGEPVPENMDLDGDGIISAAEVDAAQGDVVGLGRGRAATLLEEKRAHDEKLIGARGVEQRKLEKEKQAGEAAVSTALAHSRAHTFGHTPEQKNSILMTAVLGGGKLEHYKIADEQFASLVQMKRSQIKGMILDPKTHNITDIDVIRLSGANDRLLGDTPRQQLSKAWAVRTQISQLKESGFIDSVDTGKISAKINKFTSWFNTEGSKNVAVLNGLLDAIIPNLARGVYGEIGVLTDADIQTYKKTFVALSNDELVNKILYDKTKEFVDTSIRRQLLTAARDGFNVSGRTSDFGELTGTSLSPHIREMISPGGGGQGGVRPRAEGSERPPNPVVPQVNDKNFDTADDASFATLVRAVSLPFGTKFTGVTVAGKPYKVLQDAGFREDAREWAELNIGKQYNDPERGLTDYVHPSWLKELGMEGAEETEEPTPEVTTPEATTPAAATPEEPTEEPAAETDPDGEEVVDKITQDYINDQEYEDEAAPAPAPTETMEPPPVTTATGSTPSAPGSSLVIRESKGDAPFSGAKGAFTAGTYKGKKGKIFRRTDGKYEFESGDSSWTLTRAEARGFAPSR